MPIHGFLAKAGSTVLTGMVGAAAYDLARKAVAKTDVRQSAVVVTSWGLRGTRKAEEVAEKVRLESSDILAEAKGRIGEETTPPGTAESHDHEH